jgi:poly-gamma-glutamate synthesis protein (capsule biosynthesis protein)
MTRNLFLSIFLFFPLFFEKGYVPTSKIKVSDSTIRIKVIIAGDAMGHLSYIQSSKTRDTSVYNFDNIFQYLKSYIKSADLAIVNLETTLSGPPYKGYPAFTTPDDYAKGLRDAGFNLFVTANNHSMDYGKAGVKRTINVLDKLNISHTGTFQDEICKDSLLPLIQEIKGFRIAVLSYTQDINKVSKYFKKIINYLDTVQILNDISKAKEKNAHAIIAIVHWGNEYQRHPDYEQKFFADFFIKNGCHAVIGHHPHVIQPIELNYPDTEDSTDIRPVFYSIGNFLSGQRKRYTDGGIFAGLEFERTGDKTTIKKVSYYPFWVWKEVFNGKMQYQLLPIDYYLQNQSNIILTSANRTKFDLFDSDTGDLLWNIERNPAYFRVSIP